MVEISNSVKAATTDIAALQEERDQWKEISRDWRKEAETALIEIATLRARNAELEAEIKDRHEAEQIALAELAKADDRITELEAKHYDSVKQFYEIATEHSHLVIAHERAHERERVLVETLECTLSALRIASRQLTEDMKLVLNGKRWGESDIKRAEKLLGVKS